MSHQYNSAGFIRDLGSIVPQGSQPSGDPIEQGRVTLSTTLKVYADLFTILYNAVDDAAHYHRCIMEMAKIIEWTNKTSADLGCVPDDVHPNVKANPLKKPGFAG